MQQRKIPTILGLILVFIVIFAFRFAFERISPLLTKASATDAPHDAVFTNVNDTGFTITWLTSVDATGAVTIDEQKGLGTVFDERDTFAGDASSKLPGKYRTHSIAVRDLLPDTTYNVRILSNGKAYLSDGKPYTIRTGPAISGNGTDMEPAYGMVVYPSGEPAGGSIVYLKPEGGQTLSALVSPSGSWVIPMHRVRTDDGSKLLEISDRIDESIIIRSAEGDSSAQTDSINDNPVPDMTIGKTYDFRKIQASQKTNDQLALAPTAVPTAQPRVLGAQTINTTVAITKPSDKGTVSSTLPLIQGTGVPGNSVLILLGIDHPTSGSVTVGADGIWYFTPTRPLAEGKQSVTITTKDKTNKVVALTHTFEILKSGTQVLGDATPSATLTPTPILTDTNVATPTPTATLAGQPVPVTGSPLPLMMLLGLGAILMTGGAVMLVL